MINISNHVFYVILNRTFYVILNRTFEIIENYRTNLIKSNDLLNQLMAIDRLAGKALIAFIGAFLESAEGRNFPLKVTNIPESTGLGTIHVIRCERFERLMDLLEDRTLVGLLNTQHNILEVFLNMVLLGGRAVVPERKSEAGLLIDLTVDGQIHYELKLKRAVDYRDIGEYLAKYFDEIIVNRDAKQVWWLAFFAERVDPKAKLGEVCTYYIVVIEITSQHTTMGPKSLKRVTKNMQAAMDAAIVKVAEEDLLEPEPEEAALLPVNNILLFEKVRAEKNRLKAELAEKDQALAEKDQAITEKDQALTEAQTEKDRVVAEKDRIISDLQRKLEHLKK